MSKYGGIGYDPNCGSKDDYINYLERMIAVDKKYISYLKGIIFNIFNKLNLQ